MFVRLDGTEVFTYLPEASNCSNAGPIRVDYFNEEQWQSLRTRCTNLSLGRLAELRPSYDPNDWQANQNMMNGTILRLRSMALMLMTSYLSGGGPGSSFTPQGWVIKTGAGDDTVGLTDYRVTTQEGQC